MCGLPRTGVWLGMCLCPEQPLWPGETLAKLCPVSVEPQLVEVLQAGSLGTVSGSGESVPCTSPCPYTHLSHESLLLHQMIQLE